ncbi:hypothetical protein, partial [Avibacterium paragallinarum]|uniref:hypothetical protein n=1 Tax=Avibacterium paragallinarum TaxID=728 RepID=UPI001CC209F8
FFGEMLSALIATTRFVAWGGREMQITGFCCYFILILIYKGRTHSSTRFIAKVIARTRHN